MKHKKHEPEEEQAIILSAEEADEVFNDPKPRVPVRSAAAAVEDEGGEEEVVTGLADVLNRRLYSWSTPDTKTPVVVAFRRPPGGTREMVYRVLGPQQSSNEQIVREYMALASIVEIDGQKVAQPNSRAKFDVMKQRVGWVGPNDADWYDEMVAMFVFAYEVAMYPQQLEALAEAEASGLSPDDVQRIAKMAGLDRPKA